MAIYQTRWSAKRLRDIANSIEGKKRDVLSKSSFGDLLHISPLPPPPEELLDFIVMKIDPIKRLLKINDDKKIHFTKDMVKKIYNVPSGSRPFEFGKRGKADFRNVYLDGDRAPIATTAAVLLKADDDDEETIDRSWVLLCLSLVLAPGTGNMVPLEYLYTLRDMSAVHEFEWDEHILSDVMKEVRKYQDKRNEGKVKFLIGGCLPMLPVVYMDHLDIPRGCIVDHTIDYSLPRACFIHEMDFTAVVAVDTLNDGFGKRPFSSSTPYATSKFMSYVDQVAQRSIEVRVTEESPETNNQGGAVADATYILDVPETSHTQAKLQGGADVGSQEPSKGGMEGTDGRAETVHEPPPDNMEGDDVCGSLEEWLHALPTFEELELPPHLRVIYNKHKELHATELNAAFNSFGRVLQGLYCKRMGLMLSEAFKAGTRRDEAKDEDADVTFSVPGAPAAGMANETTTESIPQQHMEPECMHGTAATAEATASELSPEHPKQPDGTNSGDPAAEIGDTNAAPKKSNHNNGNDHDNVNDHSKSKGDDKCCKERNIEQKSPRSPSFAIMSLTRKPGTLEDGPSFGLFEPGSDDDLLFQDPPQVRCSPARSSGFDLDSFLEIRARSPLFDDSPATSAGPVYDVTPIATYPPISTGPAEAGVDDTREEEVVEVSSGRNHHGKEPTRKRAATTAPNSPKLKKMKKIKIDATDDAIYQRYCCTNYRIKDPPTGEPLPAFIRIGGFEISFKHFSSGLKKRAHVNNEVMSLSIESFNIEHMYSSTKPRKFAFSPHVATKLCVDPSSFKTSSCIRDFTRAIEKNDIVKFDQLFFTIVQNDHWAVVVVNFMQKQFNVFDSRSQDPDYVSILEKPCCNLITNFKTLVRGRNPWKHDLDKFEQFSPPGYPQQSTTFDCGIFSILYMENLAPRGMKPFSTDTT